MKQLPIKGRGAGGNDPGRFESRRVDPVDDGWWRDEEIRAPATHIHAEVARSIIARNDSPDIPFTQSINPYRGCEHGCIYCYARPSHAYLNLSPGLDFETELFYKSNAVALLERELARRSYRVSPINLGANTDPYQPIERDLRVTRGILETLLRFKHPVTIVTKSHTILRDLDILTSMSRLRLCLVMVSLTTLDDDLKRGLEPRAPSPKARLHAIGELAKAGVRVGVLAAPMIPVVNDHELERIVEAAVAAGASSAGFVLLRLPNEVKDLFESWLRTHLPLRADHVLSRIRAMRGGQLNDPRFGSRFKGEGVEAQLLAQRMKIISRRLNLDRPRQYDLDCSLFQVPPASGDQMSFGI
jgi:DNA repair photolyase